MVTKRQKAAKAAVQAAEGGDAATPATAIYDVVSNLTHDGEVYEPGDEIELLPEQAEPLMPHTLRPKS